MLEFETAKRLIGDSEEVCFLGSLNFPAHIKSRIRLAHWVDVAFGLQSMANDHDPPGMVDAIAVFHAIPLRAAALSRPAEPVGGFCA